MLQKGKDSMAKKLVIVESPHKSKTIEKYLGSEYKVVSSVGHIRDLSTSGKFGFGVDIIFALGLVQEGSTIGTVITALALMSGSSAVSEIIERVKGGK